MQVNSPPYFAFYYTVREVVLRINTVIMAVGFNLKRQVRFFSPSCFMGVFNVCVCGLLCSVTQAISSDCCKLAGVLVGELKQS